MIVCTMPECQTTAGCKCADRAFAFRRGFSDPRFAAGGQSQFDEVVEKLILAALDVLHHDRSDGSAVDQYERKLLSEKFCTILTNARYG